MKKFLIIALALSSFSTFAADSVRVQRALDNVYQARVQLERADAELRAALASDDNEGVTCSMVMTLGMVEGVGKDIRSAKTATLKTCLEKGYMSSACQSNIDKARCSQN